MQSVFTDVGEITICDGWHPARTIECVLCCHCSKVIPYTRKNGVTHYFTDAQPFCSRCGKLQCAVCATRPCNPIEGRIELALSTGRALGKCIARLRH